MLLDIHREWGYAAIVANFLAGAYTLSAWKWPRLRTRWLWWPTIVAEAMMLVQVLLGVLLVSVPARYSPINPSLGSRRTCGCTKNGKKSEAKRKHLRRSVGHRGARRDRTRTVRNFSCACAIS